MIGMEPRCDSALCRFGRLSLFSNLKNNNYYINPISCLTGMCLPTCLLIRFEMLSDCSKFLYLKLIENRRSGLIRYFELYEFVGGILHQLLKTCSLVSWILRYYSTDTTLKYLDKTVMKWASTGRPLFINQCNNWSEISNVTSVGQFRNSLFEQLKYWHLIFTVPSINSFTQIIYYDRSHMNFSMTFSQWIIMISIRIDY